MTWLNPESLLVFRSHWLNLRTSEGHLKSTLSLSLGQLWKWPMFAAPGVWSGTGPTWGGIGGRGDSGSRLPGPISTSVCCWSLFSWSWQPFIPWPFLLALLLSLSTGQMDDVLDYICTIHHSRDIHWHLPLLVSTQVGLFPKDVALVLKERGKGLTIVLNLISREAGARMFTGTFQIN